MRTLLILVALFLQALPVLAQLPVSKEPMHHNVFENAFVRVLDVHVRPGDTTQFHIHETPSVFIVLTPVKTGSEVLSEEIQSTALAKDASISFEGFYTKPRVHRVWNADSTEFHVMDVEILKQKQHTSSPLKQDALQLLFDEQPVRGYRLKLKPGDKLSLPKGSPFLVVGLSNTLKSASVNEKTFSKKGDFLFIPPGHSVRFTNQEEDSFSFAVLELK